MPPRRESCGWPTRQPRVEFVIIQLEMGRPSSIGVLAPVLVCTASVIATSGCGGGSSATQSTAARSTQTVASTLPTQARFVRQLVALCPAGNRLARDQKALGQAIKTSDLTKARAVVGILKADAEAFYRRFEGLTPSAQGRALFLRYLLLTHRYFGINERLAAALHLRAAAVVNRLAGLAQAVADQRSQTAAQLGLTRCGT
jgi:hypothetical protein